MFLRQLILFGILIFVVWSLLLLGQANRPTQMSQWVYDVYQKKEQLAQGIHEPKIVIVAGSNALFGIDSGILSEYFKKPVLNYGVNAGVELPLILHLSKRVLKPKDTVLMPLEYPMYSYNGEAGVQMIDYLWAREADFFYELTLKEQLYLLWHTSFSRLIEGYRSTGGTPVTQGLYGAHNIDVHGDQMNSQKSMQTAGMRQELARHAKFPEQYGTDYNPKAQAWFYLDAFVHWCAKQEISVTFLPSTLMNHTNYINKVNEKDFYTRIMKDLQDRGWQAVGKPYKYMYNESYYFNTNYHLLSEAKVMFTKQIIKDIKTQYHKN